MAARVVTVLLVLLWISLFKLNYLITDEDDMLNYYKSMPGRIEMLSTPLLPRYQPIDTFSHLRYSRKKAQEIVKSLQRPSRGRKALLLRCEDVETNPGPCTHGLEKQKDSKKTLRLVHLNTRSLVRHFDDVACLVSSVRPKVLALSETWPDSSVSDGELCLPGYTLFRCDRSRCGGGGGVAVYYVDHLACSVLSSGASASGVEYLWASINSRLFSSPLVLGCFY